jgi:RNA polymerase sigma-B factor
VVAVPSERARANGAVTTGPDEPGLNTEQQRLVIEHISLARAMAKRFGHKQEPTDDLEQASMLALVKVAQRFDPDRSVPFSAYAAISIAGELKRHLRDQTWGMRVPRTVKDASVNIHKAREVLEQDLGRCPSVAELGQHLSVSEESILEVMEARRNRFPASLDAPRPHWDGASAPIDDLSSDDDPYGRVIDRCRLRELLPSLDQKQHLVLKRYFFDDRTQQEVAAELGMTQMQVSRILARALGHLRSRW